MAAINLAQFKKLSIGGIELTKLVIDGVEVWKSGYTNQIPLSIEADGSVYNGGLGYKRGYRIRSGGAEQATSNTSCSGFIPVSAGDVVRISNCMFDYESNSNAINVSDADFNNIGQFTILPAEYGIFLNGYSAYSFGSVVEEKEGVWKWTVPPAASGAAYIRLTCYDNTVSGGPYEMILTINEEIE